VILVSHDRELLRALTTRVWVLHDRHITEFDGGFAEWEEVSAERARAARIRATEEQALLRVHERQKVSTSARRQEQARTDQRRARRDAERDLVVAESRVEDLEGRVGELTRALEDPALYARDGGTAEARQLGGQLEVLRRELDVALEQWASASELVAGFNPAPGS
jgi:ATP-binding cassette subfamily F protein 3